MSHKPYRAVRDFPTTISERMNIGRQNVDQLLDLMDVCHLQLRGPVTLGIFSRIHEVKEDPRSIDRWCNTRIVVKRLQGFAERKLGIRLHARTRPLSDTESVWTIWVDQSGAVMGTLTALLDDLLPIELIDLTPETAVG